MAASFPRQAVTSTIYRAEYDGRRQRSIRYAQLACGHESPIREGKVPAVVACRACYWTPARKAEERRCYLAGVEAGGVGLVGDALGDWEWATRACRRRLRAEIAELEAQS